MLIRNADIYPSGLNDVRIDQGSITAIGSLTPLAGEMVIDANRGALLPGLHDHHIHFLGFAASLASVNCSPAAVTNAAGLAATLQQHAIGSGWVRGIGYYESVAGDLDRTWLDIHCPQRPLRIQHRSGRLWIFNTAGLALLKNALDAQDAVTLPADSFASGRFYDADVTLALLLGRHLPPVRQASERLAAWGVTGFTDMTPSNDAATFALFATLQTQHPLLQNVQLARNAPFAIGCPPDIQPGPVKIHLHESRLPAPEALIEIIRNSHQAGVPVAIHCVTEGELLISLSGLAEAGTLSGDRIEHASITPDFALEQIQAMGLTVVTQPHFIAEKGDNYLQDVEACYHDALYRGRTFLERGIPLAAGSDAPFGSANPWTAMRAAVNRRTASGELLGGSEALTPEQALALFLGTPDAPDQVRQIQAGAVADLCLLATPWSIARSRLDSADVRLVLRKGTVIYDQLTRQG